MNYHDALRALLREKKAEEPALRQEFDRRVEHEMNMGYKGYEFAAQRVLLSDPKHMAAAYADVTDQSALARRVGEVISAAKRASGVAQISLADAVRQILEGERDVARKVAGDWLSARAMTQINNLNLGSSIDQTYPVALRLVMRTYPEVDQMWQTGRVSELALRTIFRQWFKE